MKNTAAQILPVEGVLRKLERALSGAPGAVLQAPAGAGKTTRVPPALLAAPWLCRGRIVMLEPRRLAARAAALRMASGFGEPVGKTVGYRMRMDARVGPDTRIEVVTEGILTRMIQADPSLSGVGLVIFDEFHERHLPSDLGLALCLELQEALRPDLRLLVMSATLEADIVAGLLGGVPVVRCGGRLHPVAVRYRPVDRNRPVEGFAADAARFAAGTEEGGILVFLPGAPEIRRTAGLLKNAALGEAWEIHPLFGDLSRRRQERAILPPPPGRRKIVLATNIAESSLTIEGIGVVVDSGWVRIPRFDPRTAMTRLVTVAVSRDSADQRRGRAGRTGPGVCIRLWSEAEHHSLAARAVPEILEADLAPLALDLALWGVSDPGVLSWLDPPPAGRFQQARRLLQDLGALADNGTITPEGRQIAGFGIHPRLGRMVLEAKRAGLGATACLLAAILEERDVAVFEPGRKEADVRFRLEILSAVKNRAQIPSAPAVDTGRCRRILHWAERLHRRLGGRKGPVRPDEAGALLARAYPDRIALARKGPPGRFVLSGGGSARLGPVDALTPEPVLVIPKLDGDRTDARIYLAAPYSVQALERQFAEKVRAEEAVFWDPASRSVVSRWKRTFGALVLESGRIADPDPARVRQAMLAGIRAEGIEALPWSRAMLQWRQRVEFLRRVFPDCNWPDLSDPALADGLDDWLGPLLSGIFRLEDLPEKALQEALFALCSWRQHRDLDRLAPLYLEVPSGNRRAVDYAADVPVLAVKLQEMFGAVRTPNVAGGKVPVLLHLLSPAGRPLQVTQDLESFWRQGYEAVKKEMRGRYPKHPWPDDPLAAEPTAGTKRRK